MVYKITKDFPKEEIFALTSQLRRCSISITSNLAEGFSRTTFKDKVSFYSIALGSLTELQNQLMIARDVKYLNRSQFEKLAEQTIKVQKILCGLIKSSRSKF